MLSSLYEREEHVVVEDQNRTLTQLKSSFSQSSISFRVGMSRLSWPMLWIICVWGIPLQGLPPQRCESFPAAAQVMQLNVSGCALDELQLASESELQFLDASHNELRQLTKDHFDKLPELVYANLSHNSLNHLEAHQLLQLQRLQLDHNELTNLSLGLCPRLLELSLNDNQLSQVSHVHGGNWNLIGGSY